MKQKACIDRFEGKIAILLVEDQPMDFPRNILPKGTKEGDWLQVDIEDGKLISAEIDEEEKARTAARIAEKLERLRRGDQLK